MKKIIIFIVPFLLASCFFSNNNEDVEKAKQEMLNTDIKTIDNEVSSEDNLIEQKEDTKVEDKNSSIEIESLSDSEKLIEIDDLNDKDFYTWEVWITWKAIWQVDKIEVNFSNPTSTYPSDLYELKQFKSWDTTFKYLASTHFQTLDFWLNEYIFTAYSSWVIYKVKVDVNLPEKLTKATSTTYEKIDNLDNLSLPASSLYWNPSLNTDGVIIYSNIKDFYIRKDNVENIKCDNLTDYFGEVYKYPYWNTCRDIIKDKSIWYYVLRLDWEEYLYEKHYINYELWLYWVLLLEQWSWIKSSMLKDKNDELKGKVFDNTLLVDKLFKEMK